MIHSYSQFYLNASVHHITDSLRIGKVIHFTEAPTDLNNQKQVKIWVRWEGKNKFLSSYLPEELKLIQPNWKSTENNLSSIKSKRCFTVKITEPDEKLNSVSHKEFIFDREPEPNVMYGLIEKYDKFGPDFHSKRPPYWQIPLLKIIDEAVI